ncbi:MAG: RES domain-containing protein [Hyphomicrobiaceae bacterium]
MAAVRTLREPMRCFRIGDPNGRFPIYSGQGAALVEGRWHERGQEVIYASENYSTAMLEKLVHYNGTLPPHQHFIELTIPVGTSYEVVTKDILPAWCLPGSSSARVHGAQWYRDLRSAILIVPSYVARMERNILINPLHPDSKTIKPGLETPVWWDDRLFKV